MLRISLFLLFIVHLLRADQITIGGTVKDSSSLAGIDSVRIDIVNTGNISEKYSVFTNNLGKWSYTLQSTDVNDQQPLPISFGLKQNYPNPFNPSTMIAFSVLSYGPATISVYNSIGQLLDEQTYDVSPGEYSVRWTSKGAAGALFYTLRSNGQTMSKKMIQLDGGYSGGLGEPTLVHGVAITSSLEKRSASDYSVTVSKLGYEPDSATIPAADNPNINFNLTTVHQRAFVIDLHNDILELVVNGYQMGTRHTTNQSDLPRFRDGGVDAQMLALWVDPSNFPTTAFQRVQQMADSFQSQLVMNAATMAHARTSAEIAAANAAGKFAGIYGVEGGIAIEDVLNKLIALYNLGARYMTITWNNSLSWATSAADAQSATKGLSDFGKQVITTMDSLGMIIDVSHTGIKTIEDILATTKNPIIASHSGVRALRNHTRNLTDDQIIKIGQGGGVIGVVFYTSFISSAPKAQVTIDTVIKHIDYIKNLVGIDYIAIGADYDGGITAPVGLEDVSKMPALTLALLKHGYSPADVRKILGGNFMRVFKQVCE
ncbi:MAG: membrane dipeptidase [Ignavibacteriales bacterium]|nr:membrane dipeptidase [Ignavibacteriales bacterium]